MVEHMQVVLFADAINKMWKKQDPISIRLHFGGIENVMRFIDAGVVGNFKREMKRQTLTIDCYLTKNME